MEGMRYEKYGNGENEYPLWLGADLERNFYNCTKERNWHENLEIQLCTAGEGTVLLDGERYGVAAGDIVVVNSNVIHRTFTENYLKYTCLIISVDWCRKMDIDYSSCEFSPFIQNAELADMIIRLKDIYLSDDALRTAKLNEILLRLMIEISEKYCSPKAFLPQKSKKFDAVKTAITYIQNNFDKKITLAQIAQNVHFDKYLLCKEFKKYTGQTVFEYLHKYRSMRATELLSDGFTVSETAYLCGFENLSFFTKVFKKCTGKKPSDFKK